MLRPHLRGAGGCPGVGCPAGECGIGFPDLRFWLPWAVASLGMQREALLLRLPDLPRSAYGRHFGRQVQLGSLLLLALVLARTP